jgi:glycosyltransferase involved in cell wall biosynthesis
MKVAFNCSLVDGPWGGGNRFLRSITEALKLKGNQVVYDLSDVDIDIIVIIDPRWRNPALTFSIGDIFRYILCINKKALVVHRINECDERKNTKFINSKLRIANYCSDHTVFVGSWMKSLNLWRKDSDSSVILNGADRNIFYPLKDKPNWRSENVMSIVTHHWGANWMKGFDIYRHLDNLLDNPSWRKKFKFTYIGNLPKGFKFRNSIFIPALNANELANELRKHDAYITASLNEPGGNHQSEGALSGLPLLYRNSGCMPEYCKGYGESFLGNDIEEKLTKFIYNYSHHLEKISRYPHDSEEMCNQYIFLFEKMLSSKSIYIKKRELLKNPWLAIRCQLPL